MDTDITNRRTYIMSRKNKKNNPTIITDGTKRNTKFETLCLMTQEKLKKHVIEVLKWSGREVMTDNGWVYSPGTIPVMICAHMDTVHKELPKTIIYKDGTISSPEGIGGDDRCGVYMCLEILKKLDCHVAFFEDEEIGGVGSSKFASSDVIKYIDVNYVIELDRMHDRDAVFYDCANNDFIDMVCEKYWLENFGSFTDICHICEPLNVAGVNLSCGYYKQHTKDEYVYLDEMTASIRETIALIERCNDRHFDYIRQSRSFGYYSGGLWRDYAQSNVEYGVYDFEQAYEFRYYTHFGEIITEIEYGISQEEAFMFFMMDHPDVCWNDILDYSPIEKYL